MLKPFRFFLPSGVEGYVFAPSRTLAALVLAQHGFRQATIAEKASPIGRAPEMGCRQVHLDPSF